jgi:signal transduction histidine kinase/phage shock protein PspC (stress-responsive transcriptional regulator)
VAGVAQGLADHLRINVLIVRAAFVALTFAGGAGIVMYAAFWVFVPVAGTEPGSPLAGRGAVKRSDRMQYLAIGAITVGGVIAVQSLGLGLPSELLWPLALTGFGVAVLWRQADESQRDKWRQAAVGKTRTPAVATVVGGSALVIAGGAAFLGYHGQLSKVGNGLLAAVVIVAGIAVITGPWWLGTVRELALERRARIREQERAELAAHLHDSVLHTLALIQRHVDDPREVQRLARSQERQLRTWLYGPAGYASAGDAPSPAASSLAVSLAEAVGEVEDTYAIAVTPVIVGDVPMDQHLAALVAAAREAMVNAAKHAEVQEISVFAEVEDGTVSVFVRDRGVGFDPAEIGADRRGLAQSIRGRMERHGGTAQVRSKPGEGTEIELTMPVTATTDPGSTSGETIDGADAGTVGAHADTKGPS